MERAAMSGVQSKKSWLGSRNETSFACRANLVRYSIPLVEYRAHNALQDDLYRERLAGPTKAIMTVKALSQMLGDNLVPAATDHPLIRKLSRYAELSSEEQNAIVEATAKAIPFEANEEIASRGEKIRGVNLLLEGFACRFKLLEDGRRQILAYLLPGDLCDLHVFLIKRMDHSIAALSPSKVALIAPDQIHRFTDEFPNLTRALWRSTLSDEAITREWVVNTGQRTAYERMAHLFCELFHRFRAIGQTRGLSCRFPLTQAALGDTLGLSSVHVNRTLQDLRRNGLISLRNGILRINNLEALERQALFNRDYLHLDDHQSLTSPGKRVRIPL
jgi:CRP-like cAMP-binding protein